MNGMVLICRLGEAWCGARFLKRHLNGNLLQEGVFGGLLFFGGILMDRLLGSRNAAYIIGAAMSHLLLTGLTMAVFRDKWEKKLLAAVVLTAITVLVGSFTESALCVMALAALHGMTGSSETAIGPVGDGWITVLTCGAGITAVLALSGPLEVVFTEPVPEPGAGQAAPQENPAGRPGQSSLWNTAKRMPGVSAARGSQQMRPSDRQRDSRSNLWYLYLSVPLAFIAGATDLVNWAASNGIVVQNWSRYGLYENQLFSHGAICLFTGTAMAAAAFFVFGMERIYREERAKEQYRSQVLYYRMLEEQYERMERLRHDMKHHIIALGSLVENRQWEQAGAYLRDMAETGSLETGDEITGSLAVDALLYHKKKQAQERGIRWQCDAKLPSDCPVKELDLCIIIGNILDNAVEACGHAGSKNSEEAPFLHLSMGTVKKCLLLEAQNSVSTEETKKASGHRGLGLGNVKAAAAAYNGAVQIREDKKAGVFAISVLLPLYQRDT